MFRKKPPRPPDHKCSNCGEWVRGGSLACRECGASYESGWGDASSSPEGGWSEDEDNEESEYQDFLRREFPEQASRQTSIAIHWWWTALILLLCSLYLVFGGLLW